jgi:ectoine hydroxylase-related dioxygenase (phytanoyl-CoA dioxygenase family)
VQIDLRKDYSEKGYVVAPRVFSPEALKLISDSLRAVLAKSSPEGSPEEKTASIEELIMKREAQDHSQVYKASQSLGSSAATYELLGASGILDLVCEATGYDKANLHLMPLYLIVQLPSDERFDYNWHQDGSYYPTYQDFLTLWFPVNRGTKRDSGTISMVPGSHQFGPRETETFLRNGFFKQIQAKLRAGEEEQEKVLETELGDCCIMNGNTVHRSVANRSTTPRIAGVLRIASLAKQGTYDRDRFYCTHKS